MVAHNDPRLTLPQGGDRTRMQVTAGVVALRKAPQPDAEMVSQALGGETVILHREEGEFGFVQNETDRYCGWALMAALSAPVLAPTHRVSAVRTYVYAQPSVKSAPIYMLSLGAHLVSEGIQDGNYIKCDRAGWVFHKHMAPLDQYEPDPADVAARFEHTPYLWGGRESLGLDCSGLMQQAFGACGIILGRDSDMQAAWSGHAIADWDGAGALRRNDLVFWKGHVGIMLDADTLLHSNGFHMRVAAEPLSQAIERIAPLYGAPTGARRLDLDKARGGVPDWLTQPAL
ncbi:MAG: NlpC/P60 family protein [Pseudomonadota bacterium]